MELPLCRLRQCVEAATRRLEAEYQQASQLAEAQAKVICTWIGANAGVWMDLKPGQSNPLVEAAQRISFSPPSEDTELDKLRGPKVADDWHDDPRLAQTAADPAKGVEAANAAGSFEAFLGAFGGAPAPPPGVNGSG